MISGFLVNGQVVDEQGNNLLGTRITFVNKMQAETYIKAHNLAITLQ